MIALKARAPLWERPCVSSEARRPRRGRRRSTVAAAAAAVGAPIRGVVILPGLGNAAGDYAAIAGSRQQTYRAHAQQPWHVCCLYVAKQALTPATCPCPANGCINAPFHTRHGGFPRQG